MIVATDKRVETGTGVMEDIEYTFEAGPHMMKILSGMYANPDEAMVREYLTNMYDAHIALFKATGSWGPKPKLSLPSALTPTLVFEDRGIGMSRDMVRTVYTRYGKSTKNESNDEVGGFGLGAKVAFAYNGGVDWCVESRKDGERNLFMARIGPNGMPVLSHVASEPTKHHSGTTVTIPVRREDICRIQDAARKLLRYFPIEIEVVNLASAVSKRDVAMEWDNWSISKGDYRSNGIVVIVGNVPYDVSSGELATIINGANVKRSRFWSDNEFVITVPVGSVEIVPSRDNLLYSDTTRRTLSAALAKIAKEIPLAAEKMVAGAATEYDALKMVVKFTRLQYVDDVLTEVNYKGKMLRRSMGIVRPVTDFPGTTFMAFGIIDPKSSEIVAIDTTKQVSLALGNFTRLLIDDVPLGQIRVAKSMAYKLLVSKTGSGRAVRWGGHAVGHILLCKTTLTPAQMSDKFGGYPVDRIEYVSQHKTTRAPAGLGINVENIYKFSGRSWGARVRVPSDNEVRYYLPLTKGYTRYTFHDDTNRVTRLLEDAAQIGFIDSNYRLFGIRADEVAKYDAKLWVNLETVIASKLAERIKADDGKIAIYNEYVSVIGAFANRAKIVTPMKGKSPLFAELVESCESIQKSIQQTMEVMKPIWRYSGEPLVIKALAALPKSTVKSPLTIWQEIERKYPMVMVLVEMLANGIPRGRVTDVLAKHDPIIKVYMAGQDYPAP